MAKIGVLKSRLIKLSVVAVVSAALSAAAAAGIYAWYGQLDQEKRTAESQLNAARRDITSQEEKSRQAESYLDLYREIKSGNSKIGGGLNREQAQEWITKTALHYELTDLAGDFEPIAPIQNPEFQKQTLEGLSSKVSLSFSAMTDVQLYGFLEKLVEEFPGYVKLESLELKKKGDITPAVFEQVGKGEIPELATGKVVFHWIGVREIAKKEGEAADAAR